MDWKAHPVGREWPGGVAIRLGGVLKHATPLPSRKGNLKVLVVLQLLLSKSRISWESRGKILNWLLVGGKLPRGVAISLGGVLKHATPLPSRKGNLKVLILLQLLLSKSRISWESRGKKLNRLLVVVVESIFRHAVVKYTQNIQKSLCPSSLSSQWQLITVIFWLL